MEIEVLVLPGLLGRNRQVMRAVRASGPPWGHRPSPSMIGRRPRNLILSGAYAIVRRLLLPRVSAGPSAIGAMPGTSGSAVTDRPGPPNPHIAVSAVSGQHLRYPAPAALCQTFSPPGRRHPGRRPRHRRRYRQRSARSHVRLV